MRELARESGLTAKNQTPWSHVPPKRTEGLWQQLRDRGNAHLSDDEDLRFNRTINGLALLIVFFGAMLALATLAGHIYSLTLDFDLYFFSLMPYYVLEIATAGGMALLWFLKERTRNIHLLNFLMFAFPLSIGTTALASMVLIVYALEKAGALSSLVESCMASADPLAAQYGAPP